MKALPRLAAVAWLVSGCTFMRAMARRPHNEGTAVPADLKIAFKAAQSVLVARGFAPRTQFTFRGPAGAGQKFEGFREDTESLKSVGKGIAGSLAYSVIGVKKDVKAGSGTLLTVFVNGQWDESFSQGVPGMVVIHVEGGQCDKNLKGEYYNCKPLGGLEGDGIEREIGTQAIEATKSTAAFKTAAQASVLAGQPATAPAGAGDEPYTAANALYATGNYDAAWGKAYEAVQVDPGHWQAWQMIGNCQYAKGDKPGALQSYRQSLAIHPDNPGLRTFVDSLGP